MQHNIRGISSKITELKHLLDNSFNKETPDIVLLCETWLNDKTPPPQIPSYNIELTNCTTKTGGGVAILIADNIQYRRISVPCHNNNYESCFVDLKTKNKNFFVGSIYRPPNTNQDEFTKWLKDILQQLDSNHEIILGMDHNMDLLKADIHNPTRRFLDTILEAGLMPSIIKPTRISHTTATLIDNIIINQRHNGNYESFVLIDNTSDHLPCVTVLDNIKTCKKDYIKVTSRQSGTANMARLKTRLSSLNYSELLAGSENLNTKTEKYIELLTEEINHFLPKKTKLIKYANLCKDPWITTALTKSMNKSKTLYKQQLNGEPLDHMKYKNYNDVLKKVKCYAKKQYYVNKCTEYKSNTRQLWQTINSVVKRQHDKSNIISQLKLNGIEITNQQTITNKFCSYFLNVGKKFAANIPKPNKSIDTYLEKIR